MNLFQQFLWVIFPYLMLTSFVVGHFSRYANNQFGWSAQSSEILEKRILKWGSNLFHYGIIFAFFGHIGGILIPRVVYRFLGVNDHLYHLGAVYFGGAVGVLALVGLLILIYRRLNEKRIRLIVTKMDWVTGVLLLIVISQGLYVTIIRNAMIGEFDYRATIGPWFRGLLTFSPDPSLMLMVPFSYQIHVLTGFLIFGLMPYTRLVHMWSLPLEYFKRSYITYRSQNYLRTLKEIKVKPDTNETE